MIKMDVDCVHAGLIDGTMDDSENHERNMQELAEELKKKKPRSSVVKLLMKHTFKGRRHWIVHDCPSVKDVVAVFPCLNQSSRVRVNTVYICIIIIIGIVFVQIFLEPLLEQFANYTVVYNKSSHCTAS